ncbi:hypothetical protein GOY13_01850 [Wolbachia endosymbiont of Cruorifilaria tuberocauda]|uniref:hypothetical protein n=1 Tax=Wolbachia endosymbiont of Cruorifilaria tuberocauda TaxID=1812111 RepID=UPI00158D5728|nr:hypothetical protein [Wolbachia endosymbiont of Cruorifilaria tuberocauda]QKX01678.1 hypothetical protein GOY13_01850 [Wolbachia endosymbiont of Cruorifilaria tuberocauda]
MRGNTNNNEEDDWGPQPDGTWIPSGKYEKIDIDKYRLEKKQHENDRPNTQLGSSNATSISSNESSNVVS